MPRPRKPFIHQGWYKSKFDGKFVPLVPASEGFDAAVARLAEVLRERAGPPRLATFEDAARAYLDHTRALRTPDTLTTATFYLKLPRERFGPVPLDALKIWHLDALRNELAKRMMPSSVNSYLKHCKAVLNFAVDREMLARSPWRKVEELAAYGRRRVLTDDEYSRLVHWCGFDRNGKPLSPIYARMGRDILAVLRFTAMRPKELRLLRWEWVHFERDLIVIPAEFQKTGRKTGQPRVIPILGEAKATLEARRRDYPRSVLVFEPHRRPGPKRPRRGLGGLACKTLAHWFMKLRERAGVGTDANGEEVTAYSLRHTRITEVLVDERWPPAVAMKMAGHTNPQTTQRYTHVIADDMLRCAREGLEKNSPAPVAERAVQPPQPEAPPVGTLPIAEFICVFAVPPKVAG